MKTFYAQASLLILVCCTLQFSSISQPPPPPDYSFKSPTLESGTALSLGAVYRFSNVKPGVSAKVTVLSFSGGVTLNAIDETWTGFNEAFQPFINVAPGADGYVEFNIEFCNGNSNTPVIQSFVPVTCIDVDGTDFGDGLLYEQDQVEFFPGYFDFTMMGGNLSVNSVTGWAVMKNTTGIGYAGVDTTAKDVMATVVNRNVSSFRVKVGARNVSPTGSDVRYRSVYFRTFNYGHPPPLAMSTILNLSGSKKESGVELNMILNGDNQFDKMIIERSSNASSFTAIGEAVIPAGRSSKVTVSYTDRMPLNTEKSYYRVRLVQTVTGKEEISNTLIIKSSGNGDGLKLQNTIINAANPALLIQSAETIEAYLRIADLSGRMLFSSMVKLNAGTNNISLDPLNRTLSYGVVMIETAGERKSTKVLIQ